LAAFAKRYIQGRTSRSKAVEPEESAAYYQGKVFVKRMGRHRYLCLIIPIRVFESIDENWKPPRYHRTLVYPNKLVVEFPDYSGGRLG